MIVLRFFRISSDILGYPGLKLHSPTHCVDFSKVTLAMFALGTSICQQANVGPRFIWIWFQFLKFTSCQRTKSCTTYQSCNKFHFNISSKSKTSLRKYFWLNWDRRDFELSVGIVEIGSVEILIGFLGILNGFVLQIVGILIGVRTDSELKGLWLLGFLL